MSPRRSAAIARHDFRVLLDDPSTIIFILGMPLLMMAFMKPLFRLSLAAEGFAGANGAEQAVPGMAVMFAAFSASYAGFAFFREHGWNTWERLRASAATSVEIMVGKTIPTFAMAATQLLGLFVLGVVLFDLNIRGSALGVVVISIALALTLLAFGIAITSISRTSQQLNVFANIGGLVFATLGGALTPLNVMPGWVQAIAPSMPTYWAMRGYRSVILESSGFSAVLFPTLVLAGFTVAFAVVASFRFRFEESKVYWG